MQRRRISRIAKPFHRQQSSFEQTKGDNGTDTIVHPVHHIVEEPGGIEHLIDCECPTEEYYSFLEVDMKQRHPKANVSVLEHLASLEVFLDTSILPDSVSAGTKLWSSSRQGPSLGMK